jgi:hypothetical protein
MEKLEDNNQSNIEEILKEITILEKENKEYAEYLKELRSKRNKKNNKRKAKYITLFTIRIIEFILLGQALNDILEYKDLNKNYYVEQDLDVSSSKFSKLEKELIKKTGILFEEGNINNLLYYAAYKNNNLSDEEKETIYNFQDLIDDNPYIDREDAYYALRNLTISYEDLPDNYTYKVLGDYRRVYDAIRIFGENTDDTVLTHELIHCIFSNDSNADLPRWFKEGMTQLLNSEYFSPVPYEELENYPYQVTMVKLLCEMTSSDVVLKAYTTGQYDLIKDSLKEKMDSTYCDNFMDTVDSFFEHYFLGSIYIEEYKDIYVFLANYYENYKGEIDNNSLFGAYISLFKSSIDSSYGDYIGNVSKYKKLYFNTLNYTDNCNYQYIKS